MSTFFRSREPAFERTHVGLDLRAPLQRGGLLRLIDRLQLAPAFVVSPDHVGRDPPLGDDLNQGPALGEVANNGRRGRSVVARASSRRRLSTLSGVVDGSLRREPPEVA